ncbi:hypothetical protein CHL67_03125 [Prosthecochloris sp. GSB1]|uniref:transposase n=1 Tax=Prosthecochloris sp. GSB1 TaxID=281093 RepID=UPI000B8C92F7|nr:transposase [Prosthecochloris sp. GSB1]ASQ90049.1 hypothetical protein CHL67_03125 [Prosthecochloris sp. GSB1]
MPRGARLDALGTLHHAIIRGIEKGDIVRDEEDRKEFLRRMGELARGTGTGIYAFALMTNHAHILLKSGEQGLSTFMRRLLSGYAQYFNRRHRRVGHLFQNRYKSIICEEEAYFDKLVAYIHLNPLRAGLVDSFEELASYPWCSHSVMMNKVHYSWLNREYVLQCFGDREGEARRAYVAYLEEEIGINREKELSGGGLCRSYGGWSNVLSMRKQGVKALSDDRILGGDSFVREVLQEAEGQGEQLLSADERAQHIARAIENACRKEGISIAVLRSGSRRGRVPAIRKALAKKFVQEYGLSLAETARQLWVTTSAVSHMVR